MISRFWLLLGLFLIGLGILGYTHEMIHQEILARYEIDSHIEYFPRLQTVPHGICDGQCLADNNLNEIVSYPLTILYCLFSLMVLILLPMREYI